MSSSHRGQIQIYMVSHMWLHPEHPDPKGTTLRLLLAKSCYERLERSIGKCTPRWGIFWDYASLYQHPNPSAGLLRTPEENEMFQQGLNALATFFSHDWTRCYKVTEFPPDYLDQDAYNLPPGSNCAPYDDRGWPTVESCLVSMTKQADLTSDISREDARNVTKQRRAPITPEQMRTVLEQKSFTNAKDDRPLVAQLYQEQFERRFGQVDQLRYESLGWDDDQVEQFAYVLASGCTPQLTNIDLTRNKFGPRGCAALARAMGTPDVLQQLKKVNLSDNLGIGDHGAMPFAEVAIRHSSLEWLLLGNCQIGDNFCKALADAVCALDDHDIKGGQNCGSLTRGVLRRNPDIADEGYRHLGRFVSKCPNLQELFLDTKSEVFLRNEAMLRENAQNTGIKFKNF